MSNSLAPQHLPLRRSVTVDDARASKCICSGDALRTLVVGEEGTVTVALPFKSTAIRSHAWRAGSNYADRPVLTVRVMRARNKTSTVVFEEKTTAILEAGGGIVKTVVTDVADQASFQNLHDEVYGDAEFGECAFLFLNVRILPRRAFCVCVPLARRACADPAAVRGSRRRAWRSAPRRSRRRWRTGSCSWASTSTA